MHATHINLRYIRSNHTSTGPTKPYTWVYQWDCDSACNWKTKQKRNRWRERNSYKNNIRKRFKLRISVYKTKTEDKIEWKLALNTEITSKRHGSGDKTREINISVFIWFTPCIKTAPKTNTTTCIAHFSAWIREQTLWCFMSNKNLQLKSTWSHQNEEKFVFYWLLKPSAIVSNFHEIQCWILFVASEVKKDLCGINSWSTPFLVRNLLKLLITKAVIRSIWSLASLDFQ